MPSFQPSGFGFCQSQGINYESAILHYDENFVYV